MGEFKKELRKQSRIKTILEGFYHKRSYANVFDMKRMTVVNLSLGGCCCLVSSKDVLELYDRIELTFNLDNANQTRIKMEASVCRVAGNQIGCKFAPNLTGYERDLIFYIKERTAANNSIVK
jgi:c-di-GMP-binding flagellar brake protein YcgR